MFVGEDYGEVVLKHLEDIIDTNSKFQKAPVNYEGVRISSFGGWFLLRLSLHDLVLPLNIEASSKEDVKKLGLAVLAAVKDFSALDTSALDFSDSAASSTGSNCRWVHRFMRNKFAAGCTG